MIESLYSKVAQMTNHELVNAIYYDHLTGLYNRRAFEMDRGNWKLVAIVDLDSLKWINDTLGHRVGDVVLKTLAHHLSASFPDRAFRLAGDEFVVVSNTLFELVEKLESDDRAYSFGVGTNLVEADFNMQDDKIKRLHAGTRTPRGEKPAYYSSLFHENGAIKS